MKKIAVISGGLLPVPATKGGAIETLLQYVIDYNEVNKDFELDIYSIYDESALEKSKTYNCAHFNFVKINKFLNRMVSLFYKIIRKIKVNKDPNFQLLFIKKVCKMIKDKKYDYIIIESDNHFVLDVKKYNKSPIILYLHNDKLNSNVKKCKKIVDSCYKIITVSDYITNRVLTIDFKDREKVKTILNGIDTSLFKTSERQQIRNKMRKKYDISDEDFVFLFTGRIEKEKGIYELINAFNLLKEKNVKLVILGGSFYSSNKKTKYFKLIENEVFKNKNIIATGYINSNEIFKYHFMCDCMVTPSQWDEPGSLVNQEAFASGIPLISSNSGGTPQYTSKTKAILINRGENFIKELNEGMEMLINNKELYETISKSQLNVSEYFSKERYCSDLVQYLKDI